MLHIFVGHGTHFLIASASHTWVDGDGWDQLIWVANSYDASTEDLRDLSTSPTSQVGHYCSHSSR